MTILLALAILSVPVSMILMMLTDIDERIDEANQEAELDRMWGRDE